MHPTLLSPLQGWTGAVRRISGALPVYAVPDQDACGV